MSENKCLKNILHTTGMLFLHQEFPSLIENPFKEFPFYTRNFFSVTWFPPVTRVTFIGIVLSLPEIFFLEEEFTACNRNVLHVTGISFYDRNVLPKKGISFLWKSVPFLNSIYFLVTGIYLLGEEFPSCDRNFLLRQEYPSNNVLHFFLCLTFS